MRDKLVVFFVFLFCIISSKAINGSNLPDSLITIENVYVYCLTDTEKAQQIIDRLRVLNDYKQALDYEMDWAQADLYFNTGKYRPAYYYFERILDYEKVKTNRKFLMGLLSTMLECYRMNNDMEKTTETAIDLLKITETDDIKKRPERLTNIWERYFLPEKTAIQSRKYFGLAEQQL